MRYTTNCLGNRRLAFNDKSWIVVRSLSDWSSCRSIIAKDVVCKRLDHYTFVLTLSSSYFGIILKGDAKLWYGLFRDGVIGRGPDRISQD